ncbi:MAG: DUF1289 domain-containing protein [Pseudomonadota bacterium]
MTDDVWSRDEVESPCVRICMIHPEAKICTGCYRTTDEIALWGRMDAQVRRDIMDSLPARASQLGGRRGGRAARLKRD